MSGRTRSILIASAGLVLLAVLVYQIPYVKSAVDWRAEKLGLYVKNVVNPPGPVPTALPVTPHPSSPASPLPSPVASPLPSGSPSPVPSPLPSPTLAPLPPQASLQSPPYEKQAPNNCGPATLSMALHMYGWEGSQEDIAAQIKPVLQDRNVNPEELIYYVRNNAGWLNMEYRVAGTIEQLKRLLAARYPVIIEGTTDLDPNDALGPNDDLWAAHYLLLTGYDDASASFTVQDSYHGPDRSVSYAQLEAEWKPFNYVYMFFYLPEEQPELQSILAADWDPDLNRQRALDLAQAATEADP